MTHAAAIGKPNVEAFKGASVLITGGAGFIGSHLAHRFVQLGARVRVLDDLSGGFAQNVPEQADLRQASILDDDALRDSINGCRYVFHQAAMVSVPESVDQPQRCAQVNILGTERVLEAARDAGVQRVIFAASAAAYGGSPSLPSREDHPPDCQSPYAASKVAGELLLSAFGTCYELSTVSLRYFNIFGPRQNPNSAYAAAISAFIKALSAGKQPTIYGDGKQTRDFTYIDNVVNANLLAALSPRPFSGEVINIGTGQRISLLDVLSHMGRVMNLKVQPTFAPPRAGDVRHSVADIGRARELLGYKPTVDFGQGIEQTLRWSGEN
ncbi:MAG: NAD-dependent epimerase/dehydratase family protein [Phycisphaerales bacterium]|nr:NAD-dependent epimerase/dehydratase family protein [Phycisphaerales bacterium]MCI0629736.1 NAD-dependent epimerase/dehydratase family protein [Phycisphaerales bacterium]MCI0677115.1 NAD-dependent epimerase/dehydratase family protein [Phycisphaerales bacterium]